MPFLLAYTCIKLTIKVSDRKSSRAWLHCPDVFYTYSSWLYVSCNSTHNSRRNFNFLHIFTFNIFWVVLGDFGSGQGILKYWKLDLLLFFVIFSLTTRLTKKSVNNKNLGNKNFLPFLYIIFFFFDKINFLKIQNDQFLFILEVHIVLRFFRVLGEFLVKLGIIINSVEDGTVKLI